MLIDQKNAEKVLQGKTPPCVSSVKGGGLTGKGNEAMDGSLQPIQSGSDRAWELTTAPDREG